ncbi:MAG: hypothetical protein ABSB63_17085 [Spirochaetia bacterium]
MARHRVAVRDAHGRAAGFAVVRNQVQDPLSRLRVDRSRRDNTSLRREITSRKFSLLQDVPIVVSMTRPHGLNLVGTLVFLTLFAPLALSGQRIRIADLRMSWSDTTRGMYPALSETVARFDVVAADEVGDAGRMEKVLAGMDDGWEAAVSRGGFFGFFYSNRVQLVKELGTYHETGQFVRPPYGAQFRLLGTRFVFNLVVCHVETERGRKAKATEIAHLRAVYHYFEELTGNRGITILLAGGLGDEEEPEFRSLVAATRGEVIAVKADPPGTGGLHDRGERVFASAALRPRIENAGISASTLHPMYVVLKTGK